MFKRTILLLLSIVTLLVATSCTKKEDSDKFKITALKVGKADAFVLETKNHTAIIDCGESDDGDKVLDYLTDNYIYSVDYMFISHFDQDHVGGAYEIINGTDVKNVVAPNYAKDSVEYKKYLKALEAKSIQPNNVTEAFTITLDNVQFTIYPTATIDEENLNNNSLAIDIVHGENSFLFTGDAECDRMKEILTQAGHEHTFLKIPHHGSYEDELSEFFNVIKPKYAVICCSKKNYADDETIVALDNIGCETYTTRDKNITIYSDGKEIDLQ